MWTRARDGETEFNFNFTMADIRDLAASRANVTKLSDDDVFDLATEIESRIIDMLDEEIGDIIYDVLGDREDEE